MYRICSRSSKDLARDLEERDEPVLHVSSWRLTMALKVAKHRRLERGEQREVDAGAMPPSHILDGVTRLFEALFTAIS